jgi:glutaredoxin 2
MALLAYKDMYLLASKAPNQEIILYYYILKTTPGVFKIQPVKEVKAFITSANSALRDALYTQYKSDKTGVWLKPEIYAVKNNAYYFASKQEAEAHFASHIEKAREHYADQIDKSHDALNELSNY